MTTLAQLTELSKTPDITSPLPTTDSGKITGGYFDTSTATDASDLRRKIAQFLGGDAAVDQLSTQSAFTNFDMERKNQERVKAFNTGPFLPIGGGDYAVDPSINLYNQRRLNDGTAIDESQDTSLLRSLGNFISINGSQRSWAEMANVITGQALTDTAGFAQTRDTGENQGITTTWLPARGGFSDTLADIRNNINTGAAFDIRDGAAGGDVARADLGTPIVDNTTPPSGAGALEVPNPYALSTLR